MMIGRSEPWIARLKDVDGHVAECIAAVWPEVIDRLTTDSREDEITERLVDLLRKRRAIITYGFLVGQFKLRAEDSHGDFSTKGILDMALFLDQDHERYVAYECKKLNTVTQNGTRASLAGSYVDEGMMRYVTAQYAEKLPFGCMIGYVMDGDVAFAMRQLETAIVQRKTQLKLTSGPVNSTSGFYTQFETNHLRPSENSPISLRHRLFVFTQDF